MNIIPTLFSLIKAIIVIVIGIIVTKIIIDLLRKMLDARWVDELILNLGYDAAVKDLLIIIVKYVLYFITFVVAIAQFGFGTFIVEGLLFTIILIFGFILIYSMKDLIPNISAGIIISRHRLFKVGDKIQIEGYKGTVREFTIVHTKIEDELGRIIVIPNSRIVKEEIINEGIRFSRHGTRLSRRDRKSNTRRRKRIS